MSAERQRPTVAVFGGLHTRGNTDLPIMQLCYWQLLLLWPDPYSRMTWRMQSMATACQQVQSIPPLLHASSAPAPPAPVVEADTAVQAWEAPRADRGTSQQAFCGPCPSTSAARCSCCCSFWAASRLSGPRTGPFAS